MMTGSDRRRPAGGTLAVLVVIGLSLRGPAAGAAGPPAAGDIYLAPIAGAQIAEDGSTIVGPAVGTAFGYAVANDVVIEPEVVFGHLSEDVGVFLTATANLLYYIDVGSRATPYFGGGLGVGSADGSDFFMHVGGGVGVAALGPSATLRLDVRVGFLTIDETNTTIRPGVFVVLPLR
jgi:hypothetical protein